MSFDILLSTETDTARLGAKLADLLGPGDCLCLSGPLGAGKTALARAIIQARLGGEIEVPSPSYTLVNVYAGTPEIWHADLYRLSEPEEVEELGLSDAVAGCVTLIEWPDRMGDALPKRRIEVALSYVAAGRRAAITCLGHDVPLAEVLA